MSGNMPPAGRRAFQFGAAWKRWLFFLGILGPGLITSSADNDATGIAGYALAGAQYGYSLLWALLLSTISLAIVQEMAGRMGAVTGKGLADLIRERFGVRITLLSMLTLLVANVTTTVAEFAGIASAGEILGVSKYIAVPVAALVVWFLVVWGSYQRVERIFLFGSALFLVYVVAGFLVRPDWASVAHSSVAPTFHLDAAYITVLIGMIGTTITPWMQFYQQAAVVDKGIDEETYPYERVDIYFGSFVTNFVAFFIIVATGATLFVRHIPINDAGDAAAALGPLAGHFASLLFALGLLNASLLAASVLPLSTAYAASEAFGWERGISRGFRDAPMFLGLYTAMIVIGAATVLWPHAPLFILLWLPNVVGGMLLPVILVLMLRLVNDKRLMGAYVNGRFRNLIALATTVVLIALTAIWLVVTIGGALR
jgi:NRAMP (natural resistance-associated macrophage protein)-like metal ion transporter